MLKFSRVQLKTFYRQPIVCPLGIKYIKHKLDLMFLFKVLKFKILKLGVNYIQFFIFQQFFKIISSKENIKYN
jgi:hypothetical protein